MEIYPYKENSIRCTKIFAYGMIDKSIAKKSILEYYKEYNRSMLLQDCLDSDSFECGPTPVKANNNIYYVAKSYYKPRYSNNKRIDYMFVYKVKNQPFDFNRIKDKNYIEEFNKERLKNCFIKNYIIKLGSLCLAYRNYDKVMSN